MKSQMYKVGLLALVVGLIVASQAMAGIITYDSRTDFNAGVTDRTDGNWEGLAEDGDYTVLVTPYTKDGVTLDNGDPTKKLYAVNNYSPYFGLELMEYNTGIDMNITPTAGYTAIGVDLYASSLSHAAAGTVYFSDASSQSFSFTEASDVTTAHFIGFASDDPDVTVSHITLLADSVTNWAPVIGPVSYANAVPEPSTFVLLGTGLLGLLAYAWRKRK